MARTSQKPPKHGWEAGSYGKLLKQYKTLKTCILNFPTLQLSRGVGEGINAAERPPPPGLTVGSRRGPATGDPQPHAHQPRALGDHTGSLRTCFLCCWEGSGARVQEWPLRSSPDPTSVGCWDLRLEGKCLGTCRPRPPCLGGLGLLAWVQI